MVMERITLEQLLLLKDRFGNFHDAVIHSITLGLFTDQRPSSKTAHLVIGAPDLHAAASRTQYEFVNVAFKLVGVESFSVIKAQNYDLSVLFHLDIRLYNDKVYLLDAAADLSQDIVFEDFVTPSSALFLSARAAYYEILPYAVRDI